MEFDRNNCTVAYLLTMNFKAGDIADILEVSPKPLVKGYKGGA